MADRTIKTMIECTFKLLQRFNEEIRFSTYDPDTEYNNNVDHFGNLNNSQKLEKELAER